MFRLYWVSAHVITALGHYVLEVEYVRAISPEAAIVAGLDIFTQAGEEWLDVEVRLA